MFKSVLTISLVSFLTAVSNLAWSSVVGEWDVAGTIRVTVKIKCKGCKSVTEQEDFVDHFVFNRDGTFAMTDVDGTWTQKKKNFTVFLDPADVEAFFEESFAEEGLDVIVETGRVSFKGTEQKNGTIKGKIAFKMDILLLDFDLEGKVSVSASFTGTRTAGLPSAAAQGPPLGGESLLRLIAERIRINRLAPLN